MRCHRLRPVPFAAVLVATLAAGVPALAAPVHIWSQRFGGTSTDHGYAAAVDGAGNVVATGYFQNSANFGGGSLTSAGGHDIYLAKYDANGAHVWSIRIGSTGNDHGHAVAVDPSGNVFVTGYFQGTVDFGGGGLAGGGNNDIFLARYDANGAHVWSRAFGSTLADEGLDVAADGSGNVIMTGYYVGTTDFGGGPLAGAGVSDIFVAKYDAAGVHQWSKRFGDTSSDHGNGVAADAGGHVVITGYYNGTVNFGSGLLASAGLDDVYLAKYDAAGACLWAQRFGGTGLDDGYGVAIDDAGNVLVTGYMQDTVSFGGAFLASAGLNDIFLAKYNGSGVHQWSKVFGGANGDEGRSVAVDADGDVTFTGFMRTTADFGGGVLTSAGQGDVFIARFDAAGTHAWSQRFGGTGADIGESVAIGADGNAVLTGQFQGNVDFGGGVLAGSGNDIVLAKYGDAPTGASIAPQRDGLSISSFPNPFNPTTTIRYTVPARGAVTVAIHDVRGARIATLLTRTGHDAGAYTLQWNGRADGGAAVASGVYFVRVEHDGSLRSKKIVLLK